jgi:DNA-binding beta-propeller fold protein YncE
VLLAIACFVGTASAAASFEEVSTFSKEVEGKLKEAELRMVNALAVNATGAGGVPAGTVYAGRDGFAGGGILRFNAKGVEEPGGWGTFTVEGIAVDQATGNVYVRTDSTAESIRVYSPTGEPIASFGERAPTPSGETMAESPGKLHSGGRTSSIAVDNSGTVYVADDNTRESRVMVFQPQSPGDYEHYVYSGQQNDIATGVFPIELALDSAGNLYTNNLEAGIAKFSPGEPNVASCELKVPAGSVTAFTVNPASGEVFYYSEKNKKIHQLSPCQQGEFVETTSFGLSTKPVGFYALAFNPTLSYGPSRPAGVLYGADFQLASGGQALPGPGHIFAPAETHLPAVESESVSSVTTSTARLGAQVNPKGSPTRYVFQYLSEGAYQENPPGERFAGATEAPLGGADLGSGQEGLSAGASLVGLQADTAYRYRAVATSHCEADETKVCEAEGVAQTFHTFPVEAPGLSDGRAYEMVSPPRKSGGEVFPAFSTRGSCFGLRDNECKPGSTADRFPMQSTPDGEAVLYEGFPFSTSGGAAKYNQYLSRRTASGWQTTNLSPLRQSAQDQGYQAFDASLGKGVLYQISPSLSENAPSEYPNLYLQRTDDPLGLNPLLEATPPNREPRGLRFSYAGASADFSRIFFAGNDALTEASPFAPPALDGGETKSNLYEWSEGQLQLVNVLPDNTETMPGAVFGSGGMLPGLTGSGGLRNFSHAVSSDGSRVFWSSEAGQVYVREDGERTVAIPDAGKFVTASADGSRVLLSDGRIYDLEDESIVDLTDGNGELVGIQGQSEDLSHIYFVDKAVLTGEEENERGGKAQAGENNLYAWDEGTTKFIATLQPKAPDLSVDAASWSFYAGLRKAEASPNGRWLAFESTAPLTGQSAGVFLYGGIFLYDSSTGKLACVSCNPSGARPLGGSTLENLQENGAGPALAQPRYLTDSGRLYFDSADSLSLFDTNNGAEDVYQYEPEGQGTCKREGGCLDLISAGHEPIDSNLLAVDETGKNVFFTSRDQLALKDRDDAIDLYDAREGGGIASETETSRGECQGEACQQAVSPPNDPTPGSSTFEGAGNVVEGKAAKKHAKKHKKHAKKKHAHKRAAKHNRGGAR